MFGIDLKLHEILKSVSETQYMYYSKVFGMWQIRRAQIGFRGPPDTEIVSKAEKNENWGFRAFFVVSNSKF